MELSKREQRILEKAKRDDGFDRKTWVLLVCTLFMLVLACILIMGMYGLFGDIAQRVCILLAALIVGGNALATPARSRLKAETYSLVRKLAESSRDKQA